MAKCYMRHSAKRERGNRKDKTKKRQKKKEKTRPPFVAFHCFFLLSFFQSDDADEEMSITFSMWFPSACYANISRSRYPVTSSYSMHEPTRTAQFLISSASSSSCSFVVGVPIGWLVAGWRLVSLWLLVIG